MAVKLYSVYDLDAENYLCYDIRENLISWGDHCHNAMLADYWIYDTYDKVGRAADLDEFLVVPVDENGINFLDAVNLNEFMDIMDHAKAMEEAQAEFIRTAKQFEKALNRLSDSIPEEEAFKNGFSD